MRFSDPTLYHSGLTRVANVDSDLLDVPIGRPPFATVLEYRGKVFSDGGDSDEYTLANFLKTYAKHIGGTPSGFTLPLGKRTCPLQLAAVRCCLHMSRVMSSFLSGALSF